MNPVLVYLIVMGLYILATSAVGKSMSDAGKPYSKWKLALHGILFLFVTAGVVSSFMKPAGAGRAYGSYAMYLACVALFAILANGARMITLESVEKKMVLFHKVLVFIITASIIAGAVL
jgi:hypothetical protein